MRENWPKRLWLVRHGQSQGNVARDAADEAGEAGAALAKTIGPAGFLAREICGEIPALLPR